MNPFGCSGMQYGEASIENRFIRLLWIYFKRLLFCVIIFVLSPIAIFFATPITLIYLVVNQILRNRRRTWFLIAWCIFVSIPLFCCGILLNLIIIPLAFILGIPALIGFLIYNKYQTIKRAKRRLEERMR